MYHGTVWVRNGPRAITTTPGYSPLYCTLFRVPALALPPVVVTSRPCRAAVTAPPLQAAGSLLLVTEGCGSSVTNSRRHPCSSVTNSRRHPCSSITNSRRQQCSSITNSRRQQCSSVTNSRRHSVLPVTNSRRHSVLSVTNSRRQH